MASLQYRIEIPKPCHEDWDSMQAEAQGRFCQHCAKTVVDFTGKTDQQILEVLAHSSQRTCGRFLNTQLGRTMEYRFSPMPQMRWPYVFLLGAMLSLASCQPARTTGEIMVQPIENSQIYRNMGAPIVTTQANNDSTALEESAAEKGEEKPVQNLLGDTILKVIETQDTTKLRSHATQTDSNEYILGKMMILPDTAKKK